MTRHQIKLNMGGNILEDNKLEKEENLVEEVKVENKEVLENKEELKEEKVYEEMKGLVEGFEDENEEGKVEEKSGFLGFLKRLLSGIVDQILAIAISLLLLVLFDAIIKLIGYQVAEREPMFLIMYIITNVLYSPILEASKLKETIGRKLIK